MATSTLQAPRDYLGHACQLSLALEQLEESFVEQRKLQTRDLVRQIGRGLTNVLQREEHAGAALELAIASLPNLTDVDGTRALLTMASSFGVGTSNHIWDLFGQILVALERGNLLEGDVLALVKETSHV